MLIFFETSLNKSQVFSLQFGLGIDQNMHEGTSMPQNYFMAKNGYFLRLCEIKVQRILIPNNQLDMNNKIAALILLSLCLAIASADKDSVIQSAITFSTPVPVPSGQVAPTLFDVWPVIDDQLKRSHWYYLRGSNPLYEASISTPKEFLFFTIYRNLVGTFLVSTLWNKESQITKINTFVRLGNGYNAVIYEPVAINPSVINIGLKPNEYMVTVNADGTTSVTGNIEQYNIDMGKQPPKFNIAADIEQKALTVDQFNRDQYWYYLDKSQLVAQSSIATSEQYYFIFIYINPIGTFLAISNYNLRNKTTGINTLVRLGDGFAVGSDFGPVNLSPSVLSLKPIN